MEKFNKVKQTMTLFFPIKTQWSIFLEDTVCILIREKQIYMLGGCSGFGFTCLYILKKTKNASR